MTARRRSRKRRPLTEFAERSPLHAVAAALIRFALLAGIALVMYLVIVNVLLPWAVANVTEVIQNRTR
jgi:hypothetical protein